MNNNDKNKMEVKQLDYQQIAAAFTKEIDVTLRSMNANGSTLFAVNAAIIKTTNGATMPVNYKAFGEAVKKAVDEALKTNNASSEMVSAVDATIAKVVAQFETQPPTEPQDARQQLGNQLGKVVIQNKDGWGNEYNNVNGPNSNHPNFGTHRNESGWEDSEPNTTTNPNFQEPIAPVVDPNDPNKVIYPNKKDRSDPNNKF